MAKINQEEYEVLKELDDKWKWIARTESRAVKTFLSKPHKRLHWIFDNSGSWDIKGNENFGIYTNYADLFQFIQWEDEDPYNIAELIEEYEYHNEPVKLAGGLSITQAKYDKYLEEHIKELENESEEAEVKKDIEWLKEEITEVLLTSKKDGTNYFYYKDLKEKIYNAVDELDEPEVLSSDWIDEHAVRKIDGKENPLIVYVDDLQNLLVPKQEEVDQAYKDGYEKGKQHATEKQSEETETVAGVFVDYLIASAKLKLALKMEVEELEE